MASHRTLAACAAVLTTFATAAVDARADDTIKTPGDHPSYKVELEPHLLFGWGDIYGTSGYGVGGRVAIPIIANGFVPSINNSVAIGFGVDLVHYDACYFATKGCSANFLLIPVVMQWNFYVAKQWSVFGEPGLYIYKGFVDDICSGIPGCTEPALFGLRPALYLGGRYHVNEHIAVTMRIGYPTISVGVSFM